MYRKVIADDGQLESIYDKRTMCMLLTKGLLITLETLRSKVLSFENIELLEDMVRFCRHMYKIFYKVITETCVVQHEEFSLAHGVFLPLIRQARQFEIHSMLCFMASLLNKIKKRKFFAKCNKIGIMNTFMTSLQPSCNYLEEFVVKNEHFHEVLPPKPKQQRKYVQKYY